MNTLWRMKGMINVLMRKHWGFHWLWSEFDTFMWHFSAEVWTLHETTNNLLLRFTTQLWFLKCYNEIMFSMTNKKNSLHNHWEQQSSPAVLYTCHQEKPRKLEFQLLSIHFPDIFKYAEKLCSGKVSFFRPKPRYWPSRKIFFIRVQHGL